MMIDNKMNQIEYNLVFMRETEKEDYHFSTQCSIEALSNDSSRKKLIDILSKRNLPDQMKRLTDKIYHSLAQRLRQKRQFEGQEQSLSSKADQIISSLKLVRNSNRPCPLSDHEIDILLLTKEREIDLTVYQNQQKKKSIMLYLRQLEQHKKDNINRKSTLKKIVSEKIKKLHQINHYKQLRLKLEQIMEQNRNSQQEANKKQLQLHQITNEITYLIDQSNKTIQYLKSAHQKYQTLQNLYDIQVDTCSKISKQKIPNQQEMINCMFFVGILKEQNFVLFHQKRQSWNDKLNHQMDKANKMAKVYQHFLKRQLTIDYRNSSIVAFNLLTGIYMHCKSLVSTNILLMMNTLSFFSDQFKEIYHYKIYKRYMITLIEKSKLNVQWQKHKQTLQTITRELPTYKKELIITIERQYFQQIWSVIQIFQIENELYINLGNVKTKIKLNLRAEVDQWPNKNKQNDPNNVQDHELYIAFQNLCK